MIAAVWARLILVAIGALLLLAGIEPASSADLPLRPNHSREQVILRNHPRNSDRPAKELLFREFLDWLRKR
jgi:hypothetical protein